MCSKLFSFQKVFFAAVLFGYFDGSFGALTCESNSSLCPEPRGQFGVPNECRKFANCWDSCATLSSCPGTLVFNDVKNKCDFAWNLSADSPCHKPMGNIGGGIVGTIPKIPAINPDFPPFAPMGNMNQQMNSDAPAGNMNQQMNPDGTMSQSMGAFHHFHHHVQRK